MSPAQAGTPVQRSALTAQLGVSPAGDSASRRGSTNIPRPIFPTRPSGSSTPQATPGESGFSGVDDVSDQEKMKVLRRHLVSAEERGNGSGDVSPGDGGEDGLASGVSRAGKGRGSAADSGFQGGDGEGDIQDDEAFPIPYDAPGMDVT